MYADMLPLPPKATGPFLHIGIVWGMTLLAWPLASFIYRTRNRGNSPPRSPPLPLACALLSPTQSRAQRASAQWEQVSFGATSALTALQLKEGYEWQTESCRSSRLGCKCMQWAKNKSAVFLRLGMQCLI